MAKEDPVRKIDRETAWRGTLGPDQARQLKSWLAAHPDQREVWEEEVALTRLLSQLPDAAAPSNLTARVLAEVDREATRPGQAAGVTWLGWLRKLGWLPRLSGVAVLVVAAFIGHHQYQLAQRNEMARRVAEVTDLVAAVPSVEVLQDFTAIRNLEYTAVADDELLDLFE